MYAPPKPRHVHVVPVNDLREHDESKDCWCKPEEDSFTPGLWIHNSMDQRELYERGERKAS